MEACEALGATHVINRSTSDLEERRAQVME